MCHGHKGEKMATPEEKFVQGFVQELKRRAHDEQSSQPEDDDMFLRKLDTSWDWINHQGHYGCTCPIPIFV